MNLSKIAARDNSGTIGLRKIVGFGGYPGAGKNTAADLLALRDGFARYAFADELREHLHILNPIVSAKYDSDMDVVLYTHYRDAVAEHGYDKAKVTYPEIRRLTQTYGTEVVRERFGNRTWVEFVDEKIRYSSKDAAISDVRFADTEIPYVTEKGGCLIWIDREGCAPMNHKADDGSVKDHFLYHIENNGTKNELYEKVKACMDEHFGMIDELNEKLVAKMHEVMSGEFF